MDEASTSPNPATVIAVVVAAGIGSRFGSKIPKQVHTICGQSLISLSVKSLVAAGCQQVTVVIKEEIRDEVSELLADIDVPVSLVPGGNTRQESVLCGLLDLQTRVDLSDDDVILIHDAVRPLAPASMIRRVIDAVRDGAAAVTPVINVADSIRMVNPAGSNQIVDRDILRAIQTPQGFQAKAIIDSHLSCRGTVAVTDDVSCCEHCGYPVTLVEGSDLAMKITRRSDLDIAQSLIRQHPEMKDLGL